MRYLLVESCAVACGFVTAGLLSSAYQWATERPARMVLDKKNALSVSISFLFSTFAAPFIVMRNALKARIHYDRPLGWLIASSMIAMLWSACSGIAVIETLLLVNRFLDF
jgi:hypothetical protein